MNETNNTEEQQSIDSRIHPNIVKKSSEAIQIAAIEIQVVDTNASREEATKDKKRYQERLTDKEVYSGVMVDLFNTCQTGTFLPITITTKSEFPDKEQLISVILTPCARMAENAS